MTCAHICNLLLYNLLLMISLSLALIREPRPIIIHSEGVCVRYAICWVGIGGVGKLRWGLATTVTSMRLAAGVYLELLTLHTN